MTTQGLPGGSVQQIAGPADFGEVDVGGIGVAYPLNPTIDIHGGIGYGLWIEVMVVT